MAKPSSLYLFEVYNQIKSNQIKIFSFWLFYHFQFICQPSKKYLSGITLDKSHKNHKSWIIIITKRKKGTVGQNPPSPFFEHS